jgi:peptidoglycan/xylan/chitin deacetylase (PgdA/CDA1 family)
MQGNYTRILQRFQLARMTALAVAVAGALGVFPLNQARAEHTVTADKSAAVIYAYQRIGEDSMPHASLSAERFSAQINELRRGNYVVKPLSEVVTALRTGEPLPPKTVALTFDGAYGATLSRIAPVLDAAEYPYTVFFSSEAVDRQEAGSVTWGDLRHLQRKKNVELGILPASYTHMVAEDMAANTASINKAIGRFREELGGEPRHFAWPYGEYSQALKNKLGEYRLQAAFGYHAGVAHAKSDFMALPRFVMNDLTGDIDRFRQTAGALPLPVSDISPESPVLKQNPPMIGFTVSSEIASLSGLSCFASGQGKIDIRRVAGNRIELRPEKPFTERRTRVNCTLPDHSVATDEDPHWRWLGLLFIDAEYGEEQPIADSSGFE